MTSAQIAGRRPMESVVRGALSLLSTQPLTWAVSLLATVLLPRLLGAQGLGEYSVLVSLGTLVGVAVTLGLPTLLTRSLAAEGPDADAMLAAAIVLQTIAAGIGAVAIVLFAPSLRLTIPRALLTLAMAAMLTTSTVSLISAVLIARERHVLYAWFNAASAVGAIGAGLIVLALGAGLTGLLACGAIVPALVAAVEWKVCKVRLPLASCKPARLLQLARAGLPLVGWSLALQVYGQIDKVILSILVPAAVVGWYAAAYRIISVPVFIPTLIVTPLLPVLSQHARDWDAFAAILRRSTVGVLLLTVPVAAAIFALAPSLPALFHWGSDFQRSVPLMMILVLHQPAVAVDMVLATGLMALKEERRWLCVGIVASLFNPAANLVLIPICERLLQNGAVAAATVTVATELLMLAGALLILPKGAIDRRTVSLCTRTLLAGVLAAGAGAWLRPISFPLALGACAATFLAASFALGAITPRDLNALRCLPARLLARRTVQAGS